MSDRQKRVAVSIQRELAELIREVKDPRVQQATLITVTHVEVSRDLSVAFVKVSVVAPDRKQQVDVMRAIGKAQPFFKWQLGQRLDAKKIPELRFALDETADSAGRIEALLREVAADKPVGAATPLDDGAAGHEAGSDEDVPADAREVDDPEG